MSDRLRAGLVGVGFMGAVHAQAVRAAGAEVSAVLASTAARSQKAAARLDAAAASSINQLVERDDVDIVHVCAPNSLHAEAARLALRHGKPVVCEKPLALDVETAVSLVEQAHQADVTASVPFVYRYYPTVREARARIANGGSAQLLHGSYLQDWVVPTDHAGWRLDDRLGGPSRAFADIGIHWCDLAEYVTGHRIARLSARLLTAERAGGAISTEDSAVVTFETDNGALGSVVISQVAPGYKNALQLVVSTADESFAFDQQAPETLWLGSRNGNRVVHRGDTEESPDAAQYSRLPAGHPQGYQDCFNAFVADTYRAVRGEDVDGLPTFADGARAAVITQAVLASAGTGEWTEVLR